MDPISTRQGEMIINVSNFNKVVFIKNTCSFLFGIFFSSYFFFDSVLCVWSVKYRLSLHVAAEY